MIMWLSVNVTVYSEPTNTTHSLLTQASPRKTRKKFKNTDVGKFVKKVGDIQINLPRVRLPKIKLGGLFKKPCPRGCGWKKRMRGN